MLWPTWCDTDTAKMKVNNFMDVYGFMDQQNYDRKKGGI